MQVASSCSIELMGFAQLRELVNINLNMYTKIVNLKSKKLSNKIYSAFSMNIPNLPIQIMAVTDSGGANAFFSNDLSHQLITEGNATADRLQAHFMTSTSNFQQKSKFFFPLGYS